MLHQCQICNRKFKRRDVRDKHILMHDSRYCPAGGEGLGEGLLIAPPSVGGAGDGVDLMAEGEGVELGLCSLGGSEA